jgi:hypothetical protein
MFSTFIVLSTSEYIIRIYFTAIKRLQKSAEPVCSVRMAFLKMADNPEHADKLNKNCDSDL